MNGPAIGYLGLGSNQGEPAKNIAEAVDRLEEAGVEILDRASLYETEPQGEVLDQPDFVNSAVKIRTELCPLELLDLCKKIEREMGRDPESKRHGPRPIDIDVLLLGERSFLSDQLVLPHREITTRRFVLEPLLEIDPDLTLPDGERADASLEATKDQRVTLSQLGWR